MGRYLFFVLLLTYTSPLMAQNVNTDFQSFRKGMIESYNGFRQSVLDNYAKYLQEVWKEYEEFRGVKRDNTPKPIVEPRLAKQPDSPNLLPEPSASPNIVLPVDHMSPTAPKGLNTTMSPSTCVLVDVPFYCMTIKIASCKPCAISQIDNSEIAKAWKGYRDDATMGSIVQSLETSVKEYGLNDWFTFVLVRNYGDKVTGNALSSVVLQHFLLVSMGYDVRIASTSTQLLLLVPFKQQVYERSYIIIEGKKYYAFYDSASQMKSNSSNKIYTCELPNNGATGRNLDLTIKDNRLGIRSHESHIFHVSDGTLGLNGAVDKGLLEALRHYPQMDVPYYAMSCVDSDFHRDLLEQMKMQISGLSQIEAIKRLLHFVQYAFGYATDEEQHGYEKPYFIEENFYYPKNDCEDRAILFAFLVRNVLGADVHLVHYPGHECTAVAFSDSSMSGDGYLFNGKAFYICDPTYIGAGVGQCMPTFKNVKPLVEQWY